MAGKVYDVIIVGGGPTGLAAAVYAARYNMKTLVLAKTIGGAAAEAHDIANYPGFRTISGPGLMNRFREQAEGQGAEVVADEALRVEKVGRLFRASTFGKKYLARMVILAMGGERRKLNIQGEKEFLGRGVSYCPTCDGPFFKGKKVAVVGGGNAALMAASYLAGLCSRVYIVHRRQEFRAEPARVDQVRRARNVQLVLDSVATAIKGKQSVSSIKVENVKTGKQNDVKVDGVFVEVGSVPLTVIAKGLGVRLNRRGFVEVRPDQSTSVDGVFAAGDITTESNYFRQIVTGAAEGAIAADSAYKYLLSKR